MSAGAGGGGVAGRVLLQPAALVVGHLSAPVVAYGRTERADADATRPWSISVVGTCSSSETPAPWALDELVLLAADESDGVGEERVEALDAEEFAQALHRSAARPRLPRSARALSLLALLTDALVRSRLFAVARLETGRETRAALLAAIRDTEWDAGSKRGRAIVLWDLPQPFVGSPEPARPVPVHGLWGSAVATEADLAAALRDAAAASEAAAAQLGDSSVWEAGAGDAAEVGARLARAMDAVVAATDTGGVDDVRDALRSLGAECEWATDAGAAGVAGATAEFLRALGDELEAKLGPKRKKNVQDLLDLLRSSPLATAPPDG
jgi:hypothetical protein